MILIQINSGLGNQMFQYAFGIALEKHYKCKVYFDINSDFDTPDYRKLELEPFNLELTKANIFQLLRYKPLRSYFVNQNNYSLFSKYSIKIVRRFFDKQLYKFMNYLYDIIKIEESDICIYEPSYFDLSKNVNVYFKGYFHNELFFKSIEDEIRNSFKLKNDYLSNSNIATSIKNSNSVSIHVRRDDYLNHSIFALLSFDYYAKAIDCIKQKVNNVRFYVFSDDINVVKQEFICFKEDFVFVEDKLSDNACDDLLLMSYCKHNIIANSTYSWWGAWLNSNENKIVVSPSQWYSDLNMNESVQMHMLPKSWIVI